MAFTDYLDLRTAVLEAVGRTDISDVFDRLTLLAESRFNRELRCRDQITNTTITVSGGSGALPADYREMIGVYTPNGCEYVEQPLQAAQATGNHYYAVSGSTIIATDQDYAAQYYASIPTLTTSLTTSNWLLQKYPEVYLHGVSAEAAKHIRDAEAVPILEQYRNAAIFEAQADDHRQRYSRTRVRLTGNIE
ncbi:MAG: hypothetical protein WBC93_15895 [Sulfitobacter sp.]